MKLIKRIQKDYGVKTWLVNFTEENKTRLEQEKNVRLGISKNLIHMNGHHLNSQRMD